MISLVTLILQSAFAMCEYPHNPPVLCLEGIVTKADSIVKGPFLCLYNIKVHKLIRPPKTWKYNDKLEKITFQKPLTTQMNSLVLYSTKACQSRKEIQTAIKYNCSDEYPIIKDLEFYSLNTSQTTVHERWEEKDFPLDCRQLWKNKVR